MKKYENRQMKPIWVPIFFWLLLFCVLLVFALGGKSRSMTAQSGNIVDIFDQKLMQELENALRAPSHEHAGLDYVLSDNDLVAPKPDPNKYGNVNSTAALFELLGSDMIYGEKLLLSNDTRIKNGSEILYYWDETILAITWKQPVAGSMYTFSEVIVSHPSQFRRFMADGKYNASILYTTSDMSKDVNAVVASAGDYYKYRSIGIVVNNGQVYRSEGELLDTCYIDDKGDLLFTYAGEIESAEEAKAYVAEHNIRFSLSFGPVMLENGRYCVPDTYNSGEINTPYARAALCQMGKLHYVVVTANSESPYYDTPTVHDFAQNLLSMGIPTAYALDGGQTATIVMDHNVINSVSYGSEREISDIIYFATAIPEGER